LRDRDAAARYEQTAAGLPPDLAGHDPFSPLRLHPELALSRQSVLRQIMQLQASGKLQESVQMLVPLIEEYPDDFRPRIYLGRALIMAGKETDGEQQLRRAVQLAPDQFETQYTLAKYLAGKAEALWPATKERDRASRLFQESAQLARRALEIDAASGQAHVLLGVDLNYLGRREQALACFRQAVQCSPEASEPHLRLGIILAEQGKKTEAEFHLEQARRLNPGDPKPAAELKKLGKGP
jgi:Flp pilus assembly protein TadD